MQVFVGVLDAYSLLRRVCTNYGFKTLCIIEMVPSIVPGHEIKTIPKLRSVQFYYVSSKLFWNFEISIHVSAC